ncbi:MAG: hypothetical protein N0C81_03195 [Candidatus Thiodiazotropha lotti]|nr:hypothetical protein [Candidatus Thiodiazotropha lotti]ODB94694.1 hypothetical protein A3197_18260 [Candidatus Thiodiazotropha endoloripes]MCG8004623.1 hypothetical protein [Candidatus Thiodiazotropha lotti]MCG8006640.1 hypothetical protein [Candidatus Thiodiazotropha lotti]MCW4188250.1 hypothetical protein [Candidatus Thiodiazotropha lotti]
MTEVIQLSDFRCGVVRQKSKPTKKNTTRPQNAISKADKAELDERINKVVRRFTDKWTVKDMIRRDIRKSCGVSRYYHITPSQMSSYINEIDNLDYKAYVFQKLRYVLDRWDERTLEKLFIDCEFDLDRFIDRVVE